MACNLRFYLFIKNLRPIFSIIIIVCKRHFQTTHKDNRLLLYITIFTVRSKPSQNRAYITVTTPLSNALESVVRTTGEPQVQARGGGGGGSGAGVHSSKFYTGRLRPEIQTLALSYTIFDRKGTLSYTFHRKLYSFHIPTERLLTKFPLEKSLKMLG